jgi:predicted sugar kinase
VESIRSYGVPGVGQSSWGPTVFAFVANDAGAHDLCKWLQDSLQLPASAMTVARPNNTGAHVSAL